MLGHGIQIMVREADYDKAKGILTEKENESQIRACPHCGSLDIWFGIKAGNIVSEACENFFVNSKDSRWIFDVKDLI